jgi:hypothetical protein
VQLSSNRSAIALQGPPVAPSPTRPSGPIRFTDITEQAGIHFKHNSGAFGQKYLPETMGSGVCVLDYDNDGWQDILFVNSKDWPGHHSHASYPALYHNERDGTFKDVTKESGLAVEMYGMGCAIGDYDNDGRDDIFITALDGSHLFHNEAAADSSTSRARQAFMMEDFLPAPYGSTTTTTASSTFTSRTTSSGLSPLIRPAHSMARTNPIARQSCTRARVALSSTILATASLRT